MSNVRYERVYTDVHFCDVSADQVSMRRYDGADYIHIVDGRHRLTLSGSRGMARQLIRRLEQELELIEGESNE